MEEKKYPWSLGSLEGWTVGGHDLRCPVCDRNLKIFHTSFECYNRDCSVVGKTVSDDPECPNTDCVDVYWEDVDKRIIRVVNIKEE